MSQEVERTAVEARALQQLLDAPPASRQRLAPVLLAEVPADRLEAIVAGTRSRVGTPLTAVSGEHGLHVQGPRGRVPAWVAMDAGRITGLRISTEVVTGADGRPPLVHPVEWGAWAWVLMLLTLPLGLLVPGQALVAAGTTTLVLTVLDLQGAPLALLPRRWVMVLHTWVVVLACLFLLRRPWDAADGLSTGAMLLLLGVAAWTGKRALSGRRRGCGATLSRPLAASPLLVPSVVVQGGGAPLNHHVRVPEQRGAVDLVVTGAWGTLRTPTWRRMGRRVSVADFACYGLPVVSPCEATVRSVLDGLPDAPAGRLVYTWVYGNHVVLDTGAEQLVLAHLQPGSIDVVPGQRVAPGQLLGRIGNSGRSTAPHLHLHAERDGLGLDLSLVDRPGLLWRGRTLPGWRSP